MLLDTFYFLKKEYGTCIKYTRVGKGDIDPETGGRDTSADITFPIDAVLAPVGTMTEFLLKFLGRVETAQTVYLIKYTDLPPGITIRPGDYFTHGNLRFRQLETEDFGGVLIALTGKTFT